MLKNYKKKYNSLSGKFLIASPNMNDYRFKNTIIYILSDNEEGSMGIIINKPALNIKLDKIFHDIEPTMNIGNGSTPNIFYGGPVASDRGFIIHTNDYKASKKIDLLKNDLVLSSNKKILQDILIGNGPSKSIFTIGYSGWDSYQLISEIKSNSWIEAELDIDLLFSANNESKWELAMSKVGIKSKKLKNVTFSPDSGSA